MLKTLKGKLFKKSPVNHNADTDREGLIAKEAYLLAEQRGFEPGHELEDWYAAVQLVDARNVLNHKD